MASTIANAHDDEGEIVIHQEGIEPFWNKLSSFFLFPLRFGPLVVIGSLSLVSVVTAFTGGLFRGLLAYLFLRYAFGVMEQAASGDFRPDSPDVSMWGGKDHRPAKQTFIFIFYFFLLFGLATVAGTPKPNPQRDAMATTVEAPAHAPAQSAAADDDDDEDAAPATSTSRPRGAAYQPIEDTVVLPWWFYVLAIVFALPLPGALMVLAIEDNIVRALNPLTTLQFLQGMGGAYFVLWFFFAAIFGVRALLMGLIPETTSAFIKLPLEMFIGSYMMLALFALMGYCLYQYHQELGYDVKVDFDTHRRQEKAAASAKPVDPLTRSVEDFVAQGKVDDAMRVVHDAMRYDKLNPDLNEKLFNLCKLKGDAPKTLAQGAAWLKALAVGGKGARALQVLQMLKAMDPAFTPEADAVLGLAEASLAARNVPQAVDLVKGFDKRFPGHADIPGVYFLGARISSEHLSDDNKAIAILKVLLQRYPQAAVSAEAQKYLTALTSLAPAR